ncbi:MAG: GTP-binding protein [Verrucomicrobiaceae bacterium]|nr:GTP-binding protein [Verrucomicrobiaceae bacterium]
MIIVGHCWPLLLQSIMQKRIPTNVITGFLGAGKTTAILDVLARKPAAEKWAVLVNEFGEIGIDGAILSGRGAEIREVPGGCMCCVADLPMKIALNNLITRAKPDRLLIEPSGLGHPQEIIDTLSGEYYRDVLDMRAVITLVDPRKLANSRYTGNQTFNDQLQIADVVVANKIDLSAAVDRENFQHYVECLPPADRTIGWVSHGRFELGWFDLPHGQQRLTPLAPPRKNNLLQLAPQITKPIALREGEAFARRENHGDGFYSCGWRFAASTRFNFQQLMTLLSGVVVDRLKAVLQTDQGVYIFNAENGVLGVNQLPGAQSTLDSSSTEIEHESVIELIHSNVFEWSALERPLLAARY